MNSSELRSTLIVSAAMAVLSACGGGGGDDSSSQPAPTPVVGTGLGVPTLTLAQSQGALSDVLAEMNFTYPIADEAQATKALGSLVPGIGSSATSPYSCSGGGQINVVPDGTGNLAYTYVNCSDGTYTFNGASLASPTLGTGGVVTSYLVSFTGLQVSGPAGLASPLSAELDCLPAAAAGQAPSCTSKFGGYVWGYDISYASNGVANGTHQCDCGNGAWNVTFENFTATSGKATVFATNGYAVVTRTGTKTFKVVLSASGSTQSYDVTLP